MSHRRWTRTARYLLAAAVAVGVGGMDGVDAQDAPPPPIEDRQDTTDASGEEATGTPAPESPPDTSPTDQEVTPQTEPQASPEAETASPAEDAGPAEPTAPGPLMVPLVPPTAASPPSPLAPGVDAEVVGQALQPAGPPPVAPSSTPWSFSLTMGYYAPRLSTLNRILEDTSVTMLEDPNFLLPRNLEFSFEQRNLAVDGIKGGPIYGVDTFYNTGGPHSFGLSFSSWRGETTGQDTISIFLRSNDPVPVEAPRSARYNLILDRILLEWRYHLFRNPEGKGLYLNAGLLGVTLAFFTMDALVNVIDPADQVHFASVSSNESFGWGYTTRFGVGGDYPLTSWLSIGGRANYVLGNIRKMTVTRHFLAGFPQFPVENPLSVRPGVPLPQLFFPPRDGTTVEYATVTTTGDLQEEAGTARDLVLELSGWEGLIELAVRF